MATHRKDEAIEITTFQLAKGLTIEGFITANVGIDSRQPGSGISSAVTSHGPRPPVRQKFLPEVTGLERYCQPRTLPSLKHVYPAT
jgi:hypothetical protein